MEEYTFSDSNDGNEIQYGKFSYEIFNKQKKSYGEEAANNTRDNAINIFSCGEELVKNNNNKKNILIIGKVQSGKTSNLEMLTAIALDNGYDGIIIYGGYDSKLLKQTYERFRKTFDIGEPSLDDNKPLIYSSADKYSIISLSPQIIKSVVSNKKPLIFVSMKRVDALKNINSMLKKIEDLKLKFMIIDDEGDQASLNTEKDKATEKSATYKQICFMKKHLGNPLYLSVTATPHANTFLSGYSELKPEKLILINPNRGYNGALYFHSDESKIVLIEEDDEIEDKRVRIQLIKSVNHFLISSSILRDRKIKYSDMIIHAHRNVTMHSIVFVIVSQYISQLQTNIINEEGDFDLQLKEIEKDFNSELFSIDIVNKYTFSQLIEPIKEVIMSTKVILANSKGKATQSNEELINHKIYIGGDLLQRGLTFKKLVTTYFTRWAKQDGNMDTNLQRARWFGYRGDHIDLCKLFMTEKIKNEFAGLMLVEEDMWEQFRQIENNELEIEDIVISADETTLKPTRKNVVDYDSLIIRKNWFRQKYGIFDILQVENNNKFFNSFLAKSDFEKTSSGRNDGMTSALYTKLDYKQLEIILENYSNVFADFGIKKELILKFASTLPIYLEYLTFDEELNVICDKYRLRSFDSENKISYLQQGADKTDISLQKYKGDSKVIVDANAIIIQVSKIRPVKKKIELNDFDQYMFAIYLPFEKRVFVREK